MMNPDAGPYEALYSNEQSLMGKGASKSYCKRNIKYVTLNEPYMKTYQTTLKCKRPWNLNKNIKKSAIHTSNIRQEDFRTSSVHPSVRNAQTTPPGF